MKGIMKIFEQIEKIENSIKKLTDESDIVKRILQYSKENEITYHTKLIYKGIFHDEYTTYIYKDKKEYKIEGLKLYGDVTFEERCEDKIYAICSTYKTYSWESGNIQKRYFINLSDLNFVDMGEDKNKTDNKIKNNLEEENNNMELKDTIEMMNDAGYKERFKAEYYQLKIRYEKLKEIVSKWDEDKLLFKPTCPRGVYDLQLRAMSDYINILEARAKIENIVL